MTQTIISAKELHSLVCSRLEKHKVPRRDAAAIAGHLVRAELRGYQGHGVVRLPRLIKISAEAPIAQKRRFAISAPGFLFLDGNRTLGIAAVTDLLGEAQKRAGKNTAVVAAVSNYVGTTGALGVYGAALADAGFISILMCSSEFAVAPHGARRAILGTNPVSISVPGPDFPFVADVATAAWSYGALRDAMEQSKLVPTGVVQTIDGYPSTDPHDADNGSQLPMSGHKGYALGLAIEILCGPFLGGKAGRDAVSGSDGLAAIVIKADAVRSRRALDGDLLSLFSELRAAPLAPGFSEVRIPGQRASQLERSNTIVSLEEKLLAEIRNL